MCVILMCACLIGGIESKRATHTSIASSSSSCSSMVVKIKGRFGSFFLLILLCRRSFRPAAITAATAAPAAFTTEADRPLRLLRLLNECLRCGNISVELLRRLFAAGAGGKGRDARFVRCFCCSLSPLVAPAHAFGYDLPFFLRTTPFLLSMGDNGIPQIPPSLSYVLVPESFNPNIDLLRRRVAAAAFLLLQRPSGQDKEAYVGSAGMFSCCASTASAASAVE